MRGDRNSLNEDIIELQEKRLKKGSIVFLADNITIGINTIKSYSDAYSADCAKSAFKIVLI